MADRLEQRVNWWMTVCDKEQISKQWADLGKE